MFRFFVFSDRFLVVTGSVHVKKAMYQQIQGLNTDDKGLEISKI